MEYFRLEHPAGKLILCDDSVCDEIADYLELDEADHEHFVCATHTSSDRHASVLPAAPPTRCLVSIPQPTSCLAVTE
jgi:hypothetical protein